MARLCEFPGLAPLSRFGTGAERALWAMKRGGASGTARSTGYGATMQAPRTEIPQRSLIAKRSKKKPSGSEALPDGA